MSRAVIFTEGADWHTRELRAAIERQGMDVTILSMAQCGFSSDGVEHGLLIPRFQDTVPDAVFVRIIPTGTTEQITVRLGLLHALAALGVRVVNDAQAIERCVDKSMTSFLLRLRGLPTPRTWAVEDVAEAQAILDEAAGDLVLKPLFGAQGRGLRRLSPGQPVPQAETVGGVYYLQEFIQNGHGPEGPWRDWRVFVIGDEPVASMIREGTSWITNIHQGATPRAAPATGEVARLAVAAARAVGAGYAGVDLIEDKDGRLLILEVNSMPAWKGLQQTTEFDIAGGLAALLVGAPEPAPAE